MPVKHGQHPLDGAPPRVLNAARGGRYRGDAAAQTERALVTLQSMLSLQCTSQRGNPRVFDDQ
jgi:hypothetical protein